MWRIFSLHNDKIQSPNYQEIRVKESNAAVECLPEAQKWPFLRMRSENMAKIALNAAK